MKTKAQFEIIGLAIIVIIVMVGIFFLLSFGIKPTTNPAGEFQQEQFAQNILDAMRKTSLPEGCTGNIGDLVTYAVTDEWPTGTTNTDCTRKYDATKTGEENLGANLIVYYSILNDAVIKNTGRGYIATINTDICPTYHPDCSPIITPDQTTYPEHQCNPRKQGSYQAGHQIISLYPHGNAEITLQICKS